MGRCGDCKYHGQRWDDHHPVDHWAEDGYRLCVKLGFDSPEPAGIHVPGTCGFYTGPEFGCVHFERSGQASQVDEDAAWMERERAARGLSGPPDVTRDHQTHPAKYDQVWY